MKLWLAKCRENLPIDDDPWDKSPFCAFAFVIRAATEQDARTIAHTNGGNENHAGEGVTKSPWLEDKYATCVELTPDGLEGVVVSDIYK